MNKLDVIDKLIDLSERSDYVMKTDRISQRKYTYNEDSLDYIVVEYGMYIDTKGGWLKYYTKDVYKYYLLNPIEIKLIKNLFE